MRISKMMTFLVVKVIVGLLAAGTAWTQYGGGSIVGWGGQVVGVDPNTDFVAVAAGRLGPWCIGLESTTFSLGGRRRPNVTYPPDKASSVCEKRA